MVSGQPVSVSLGCGLSKGRIMTVRVLVPTVITRAIWRAGHGTGVLTWKRFQSKPPLTPEISSWTTERRRLSVGIETSKHGGTYCTSATFFFTTFERFRTKTNKNGVLARGTTKGISTNRF